MFATQESSPHKMEPACGALEIGDFRRVDKSWNFLWQVKLDSNDLLVASKAEDLDFNQPHQAKHGYN